MRWSEFRRVCAGIKLLSLCHGFRRPKDGLDLFAARFGVDIYAYGTEIDASHDLADEGLRFQLMDCIHKR